MNLNIWQFQHLVTQRLVRWSLFSIITGIVLLTRRRFWRSVGVQFIGWGVIDLGIALFGGMTADRRVNSLPNPHAVDVQKKEARSLSLLLWINAALDLLYVVGGVLLARRRGAARRGTGVGVILQGGFLLIFDVMHGLALNGVRFARATSSGAARDDSAT